MTKFIASKLPSRSTDDVYHWNKKNTSLPGLDVFKAIQDDPSVIPLQMRVYDLVFPRVVLKGDTEGGGADKVTDDHIGVLVWVDDAWCPVYSLTGPNGLGRKGPDILSPRARLLQVQRE